MVKLRIPGPVFRFEVLTGARRWEVFAARSAFVAGLLAGLTAVWWGEVAGRPLGAVREQAEVGRRFYRAMAGTQLALALLAAPAAAAGAIGMDRGRGRGTLSHLLVTDLSAGEIVLGKLGARVVPVAAMALCGLPFVAIGTLLGGIDPADVAGLILVSLGGAVLGCSLAMALSLVGASAAESTLLSYGVWLALVLVPPAWFVLRRVAGLPPWPLPWWLERTSPVLLVFPTGASSPGGTFREKANFLALALALSAGLAGVATARLRATDRDQGLRGGWHRRLPAGWRLPVPGPSLDANPVLWREWQVRRPGGWGLVFWGLYALLALGCTAAIPALTASSAKGRLVACGFLNGLQVSAGLLLLSLSAANALAEERVRGSLDVLLTTPLSTRSIVWGKWWGAFRAVPLLAVPPGLALAAVAWRHGHWPGVWLVVALVVAYGAALTSLGLALATWVPRPGQAAGLCAAAHVSATVGWVLFVAALTPRAPGITGPGRASFSPFMGVMLPTVAMQIAPDREFRVVTDWLSFWIAADAALAALLMLAVLLTFDRCLGRSSGRPERDPL